MFQVNRVGARLVSPGSLLQVSARCAATMASQGQHTQGQGTQGSPSKTVGRGTEKVDRTRTDEYLAADVNSMFERLLQKWKEDPKSVHETWNRYLTKVAERAQDSDLVVEAIADDLCELNTDAREGAKVAFMVRAFQKLGHFYADVDPLGLAKEPPHMTNQR